MLPNRRVHAVGTDDDVGDETVLDAVDPVGHLARRVGVDDLGTGDHLDPGGCGDGIGQDAGEMAAPNGEHVVEPGTEVRHRHLEDRPATLVPDGSGRRDVGTAPERLAEPERVEHRQPVRMEEDASPRGCWVVEPFEERDPSAAAGEGQGGDAAARTSPGDDDIEVHGHS